MTVRNFSFMLRNNPENSYMDLNSYTFINFFFLAVKFKNL